MAVFMARNHCRMANNFVRGTLLELKLACGSMTSIGVGPLRVFDGKVDADENKKHPKALPATTRRNKDAWVLLCTERRK